MLRKLSLCALFVFLLACGGGDQVESSAPDAPDAPNAPVAKAELTDTVTSAEPASRSSAVKTPSSSDPLVQTRKDPPGDLAFVFTNNVDGEIEPCG